MTSKETGDKRGEGEAMGPLPAWAKKAIGIIGLLWALLSLPALLGWLCASIVSLQDDPQAVQGGVASLTLLAVTGGAGAAVAWHAWRSLAGKASAQLRLPPAWLWAGLFALCVVAGSVIMGTKFAPGLFFPPLLLAAAAAPPLLALSWFTAGAAGGLTWRRGLSALAGGATLGVLVALTLEILLSVIVLALVAGLADVALPGVRALLDALAGKEVATAVASPGFVFVFIEIAVIAPLVEEFAKPLVTLPLLGRLARRDAFLVAAMAGAGFAALENVIYTGFGLPFWVGILVVRALGGAIHPLGAGLVGLGWRDVLRGEARAGLKLAGRFGVAVGMHALWNGGSLLVITLAGARFFGELPPEIDILGLSAAGTTLALLVVLGLFALWLGRFVVQRTEVPVEPTSASPRPEARPEGSVEPSGPQFALSDRAVAIWALACLAAIVPAGIAGLQLLMR